METTRQPECRATPLRVRVLAGRLDPGAGSHVYNRELIQRLLERGHEVSVVCLGGGADLSGATEVHELPLRGYADWRLVWPLASVLELRHLSRALRRAVQSAPDVVIGAEHMLLKAHADAFEGVPLIYVPHALVSAHEIDGYNLPPRMAWFSHRVYRNAQRWALTHAEVTMRFTAFACDALKAMYREAHGARFLVNPIGVRLPANAPDERTPADTVRLLYVGQLIPRKRVDLILRALSKIPKGGWTLDVVGDGPLLGDLQSLATERGLADATRFWGFQPDPTPWYRKCDLLLLCSQSESLGMVVLEAMSHAVPCLALLADGKTTFNPLHEIITNGKDGLLVDGEPGLVEALDAVVREPRRLAGLGERARDTVATRWSWSAHIDVLEAEMYRLAKATST